MLKTWRLNDCGFESHQRYQIDSLYNIIPNVKESKVKFKIANVLMCAWVIPILIVGFNVDILSTTWKIVGLSTGFTMLGLAMLWMKN